MKKWFNRLIVFILKLAPNRSQANKGGKGKQKLSRDEINRFFEYMKHTNKKQGDELLEILDKIDKDNNIKR